MAEPNHERETAMRHLALLVLVTLGLAGCISFSSSDPSPPPSNTVVVPAR